MAEKDKELIEDIEKQEYKYGFTSDIETETIPRVSWRASAPHNR